MNKLTLITFFCCFLTIAQNPYSIEYSLEEGLPTSNVYSSFEDHQGFIWFATDVGVLKYNGYEFKHYSVEDGLGDNEVFKIFEDSKNRLWFLTLNGQLSYFEDHVFYNTKNNIFLKKVSHQKMLIDVFEDDAGSLNFLYIDGVILKIDNELSNYNSVILNKATYSIWKNGVEFNALTRHSIRDVHTQKEVLLQDDMISIKGYRYYRDTHNYYFTAKNCVYEYINKSFIKIIELSDADIIFITKIDDNLWIGTRKGLYILKGDQTTLYFKNDSISSVLKDTEGNIWLTTLNNGIKMISNMNVTVHDFNYKNLKINTIENNGSNTLWVGSEKGLHKLYPNRSFQNYRSSSKQPQKIKKIRNINDTMFVIGDNSTNIYKDSTHTILSFGANDIYKQGKSYFLASSVVFKFKASELSAINNDFKNLSLPALEKYRIYRKRTNVISNGFDNSVLLGTSSGLFKYDDKRVQKINFENGELDTSIIDVYFDKESERLLVASNSKGVITYKKNGIESHLTSILGLNSNGCNTIEKINTNTYYIGTNKGLNKIEFKNQTIDVLNYNTVLKNVNERINDIEIIDSLVYLATDRGLLSFNSNIKPKQKISPRLIIENIYVNDSLNQDLFNLRSSQNDIRVGFTGISYADFGNLTYDYKFINDESWSTTTSRQLNFKNLSDGNYSLQIRSKGINNLYSPTTSIDFIIAPPFWRTLPFVLLMIILFFLITIMIIKKRIKMVQSRFETERKIIKSEQDKMNVQKQMIELEQKAMRLQMNPHFIFNALNTIKGYYSGGNIKEANHYISKFSKLLRLILENDQHMITLNKEIKTLELYLDLIQLRYKNVFSYEISISNDIKKEELGIPPLLLQPIVENAVIHGLAPSNIKGVLQIKFSTENDTLICKVIDNGVGFKISKTKNSVHKSKAIEITQERINFLNNSKATDNFQIERLMNPSGTSITIKLPLHNLWK